MTPQIAALGREAHTAARLSRIDDYLHIGGDRLSAHEAAKRVGVSVRTICRYRADLRAIAIDAAVAPCTTPTAHRADECNGYHLDRSDL